LSEESYNILNTPLVLILFLYFFTNKDSPNYEKLAKRLIKICGVSELGSCCDIDKLILLLRRNFYFFELVKEELAFEV